MIFKIETSLILGEKEGVKKIINSEVEYIICRTAVLYEIPKS